MHAVAGLPVVRPLGTNARRQLLRMAWSKEAARLRARAAKAPRTPEPDGGGVPEFVQDVGSGPATVRLPMGETSVTMPRWRDNLTNERKAA